MNSCNKRQQATMTSPIVMGAIKAITDRYGHDQRLHREAPKRSQEGHLKCNEEGRDNQPRSHTAALPMNTTRASWGRCEYHNDTNPVITNIAARASIAAKHRWQMQTAMFCHPAQESRVVRLTQQWQLSSPSAWLTWVAQALQQRWSRQQQARQQEKSPQVQGQGHKALMPTRRAHQSLTWWVLC
jgi:hypothetical protein